MSATESPDGTGGDDLHRPDDRAVAATRTAWPILVHCHASMDRSPAWVAMYRFVVQGWPLADAIKEIERHRGLRPRASVTVLYEQVLPRLAPERCAADPTFAVLKKFAEGAGDFRTQVADPDGEGTRAVERWSAAESAPRR